MQPDQPLPPQQPYYYSNPQPMPPSGRPSKRKQLFIIGGVVLVLWLGSGLIFWLKTRDSQPELTSVAAPTPIANRLSEADVAQMDKETTFWGYFKNAAMQQQLVTTHKEYDTDVPGAVTYRKVGFDYQTKKLVMAVDTVLDSLPGVRSKNRCYDSKSYLKITSSADAQWRDIGADDPTCGLLRMAMYRLTDGTNAGGLTEAQADTFVNLLRSKEGLAHVRSLTLEEHGGKQYLHYTVDFVPIPTFDNYSANFWFGRSIREAGVDPDKLPYGKGGVIGGGTHLEYFVDPATGLPAYSKTTALPLKDKSGQDLPLEDFSVLETTYQFGISTFDADISNETDLTFDW